LIHQVLSHLGLESEALFSTLGRIAARGIETQVIAEKMGDWIGELEANMNNGELSIHNGVHWDPSTWPAQAAGWGVTEAPRGALGHWVRIENGAIANYQCVVPSTWNGSPRDAFGQRGPWEEALIGTPVADAQKPVEILRTIHSFDPCMACAVHVLDAERREVTRVRVI
jgi:[NiFe] hydrogenase large subunit/hydrogenase large subunit